LVILKSLVSQCFIQDHMMRIFPDYDYTTVETCGNCHVLT